MYDNNSINKVLIIVIGEVALIRLKIVNNKI